MQKVLNFGKKSVHQLDLNFDLLNASQLHYPLSYPCCGFPFEISPLLCLQLAAECNLITAFTRSDKLEVGG